MFSDGKKYLFFDHDTVTSHLNNTIYSGYNIEEGIRLNLKMPNLFMLA
jgi:hypothetical protein